MFAQMFPCLPHLETLAFIAETKFASWKTKIFPTKLETFDETLFLPILRLPTLVRQYKIPNH
jgi:hypothetical protein